MREDTKRSHAACRTDLIACAYCDCLYRMPPLQGRAELQCLRCGATLYSSYPPTFTHTLAFALTALILFVLANSFPLLSLEYHGIRSEATLLSGISLLIDQGYSEIAILVVITSWLMPLAELIALLYILLPLHYGWILPGALFLLRGFTKLRPWSMSEVYLLGLTIAAVKLNERSDIVPGVALWAFVALIFVLAATLSAVDMRRLWHALS